MCRSLKSLHSGVETLSTQNDNVDNVAYKSNNADNDNDDSV